MPEKIKEAQEWAENLEDSAEKFKLGSIIGTGNSSVVYDALDSDGNSVAIKMQEGSETTWEAIHAEFKLLTLISGNPKFPKLFGAYRSDSLIPNQIWFILELCEEGSVQTLLWKMSEKDKSLTEQTISYILRHVILSLNDLHNLQIIHRDVKAANILISKNGEIKLTDLGMAIKMEEDPPGVIEVVGSPCWMAPEVVVCERQPQVPYDTRADVWSLGITAAELADGHAPRSEVYSPRALFQIVQHPPPTLSRPDNWSTLFNDFIAECLEKNPDHRPWLGELPEHPFIVESVEQEATIRGELLKLVNEFRDESLRGGPPEVSIMSDLIKLERNMVPTRMYRDDLATLYSVSEDSVLETLQQRFTQGNCYTYLGDIMIVLNPFHDHPIYGPEVAEQYKYRARCDNAPHIYGVGDRAYQDMMHHQQTQNIILTGETGSGKTTAGKHLLWHLANMAASNKRMIDRLIKIPVIMEAFGHASSAFNDNSTRYIQYLELTFTKTGKMSGGILWAYCLEKWRVTHNQHGVYARLKKHSNFHIFYYVLDALCATDTAEEYFLKKDTLYEYLPTSSTHPPPNSIDQFRQVKEALTSLGFTSAEQENVVKIICAILLIGQIKFNVDEADVVTLNPVDVLENIATLLKVDAKKLDWALKNYCIIANGEAVRAKSTVNEAEETRDSLARNLYARMVDWIVNLINTKLSTSRLVFGDQHSLGILDIPGFECFTRENTFDQFLVNLTNEQMQFFYNQRVFTWEMEDYVDEELNQTSYNYHDNRELLDMVLSKPKGFLAYLDAETRTTTAGNTNPQHFLDTLKSSLQTWSIKVPDESNFTIVHYSGKVKYNAKNFIERNKNFLSPEIIEVMRQSGNSAIVQLFTNPMTKTGNLTISTTDEYKQTRWTKSLANEHKKFNTTSRGKFSQTRQMQTVASTIRHSLLEVLQKVYIGSAHFVRCMRPNLNYKPFQFDHALMKYQLITLGIVDSIRVRQLGYSSRLPFAEFLKRYKFLAFDFDEQVDDTRDNCRLLLIRLKLEGYALGENKVMLKYFNEEYLSRLYEQQVHKVIKIQALMRAFLSRKRSNVKTLDIPGIIKDPVKAVKKLQKTKLYPKTLLETPEETEDRPPSRTPSNVEIMRLDADNEEEESGRRTPREIAKAFEAESKKHGKDSSKVTLTGRCMPSGTVVNVQKAAPVPLSRFTGNSAAGVKPASTATPNVVVRPTSGPEIINPLIEFTNAANKMYTPTTFDEPGPFNFQAMLRKTNKTLVDLDSRSTAPISECFGQRSVVREAAPVVSKPDISPPKRGKLNSENVPPPIKPTRSMRKDALPIPEPEVIDSFTPSPEILTRRTSNASSVIRTDPENEHEHTNGNGIQTNCKDFAAETETVILAGQLVLEGISEDL